MISSPLAVIAEGILPEHRDAALWLVWTLVGAAVALVVWPRGRRIARQVAALAVLGFREGVRARILWTVAVLAFIPVVLAYFSDADGTHAGRARVILNAALGSGEILGAALIVLLSALSVAHEIESRIMHTLGSKPVPRAAILLGKALGFWAIGLLFVAGLLLFAGVMVRAVPLRPETRMPSALASSGTWSDLRRNALTTRHLRPAEGVRAHAIKAVAPGERYELRFPVSAAETHGEPVALRFLLSSSMSVASEISDLSMEIGYDGQKPIFNQVAPVPRERPFELFIDPPNGDSVVTVTLTPAPGNVKLIVPQPQGVQLGVYADGLWRNLGKAFLLMALQGWVLALVTTSWSGVLSFPVTVALGLLLILGGEMSRYAVELLRSSSERVQVLQGVAAGQALPDQVTQVLNYFLLLLPDFRAAGGPAAFVEGAVLSAWAIVHAVFWMGLVYAVAWAVPGAVMFQRREVGR